MLYDPKWEQTETKPDLEFQGVTLRGLIAWLETKDPDERYRYCDSRHCALGQYKAHLGHDDVAVDFDVISPPQGEPRNWLEKIVIEFPRTFGGALERARAAL